MIYDFLTIKCFILSYCVKLPNSEKEIKKTQNKSADDAKMTSSATSNVICRQLLVCNAYRFLTRIVRTKHIA